MPGSRGNVLFVTIDQFRADAVAGRLAGLVPMPALDRLRREGTYFPSHFTVTAPCGPARASLMTGQYAFNHRSIRNGTPLAHDTVSLGPMLQGLGYEPLLFGYGDIAADPRGRAPDDPDLLTYELPPPGFTEVTEMRFEHMGEWRAYLEARGYALPQPQPGRLFDIYRPVPPEGRAPRITDPPLYRAEDSDTAFLTDRVLEHLDGRQGEPWFAHVTYIRPHPPFVAPAPWNAIVDPANVPPPIEGGAAHPFREAWFVRPSNFGLWVGFDGQCDRLTADQIAELRAVYLGLAAEVDHHLGRILDWLDETGQAADTLVVVTSDHGEMLGDQGYWGKDAPFMGTCNVPLIIRDPRRMGGAGQAAGAITESVDIAPTILSWLGADIPRTMDGRSLLDHCERPEADGGRGMALTEIDYARPDRPTRYQRVWGVDEFSANAAAIRDKRWTCIHFNGGLPPLLFDRARDPDETQDLAGDPAAAGELARLRTAMLDLRMTRAGQRLTGYIQGG